MLRKGLHLQLKTERTADMIKQQLAGFDTGLREVFAGVLKRRVVGQLPPSAR